MKMIALMAVVVLLAGPGKAQVTKEPPGVAPTKTVECPKQADNCRACRVLPDGKRVCSNIGIACQPRLTPCPVETPAPASK